MKEEFRKMRRFGQQLSDDECRSLLTTAKRGVLAVAGENGYPYALPLDFVYDPESETIYFHSAIEGHKLDALKADPKASFCVLSDGVQEEGSWWYHFKSVIAFGTVTIYTDMADMLRPLRLLGGKYFPPSEDMEADIERNRNRVAVLALRIDHMTGKRVREK